MHDYHLKEIVYMSYFVCGLLKQASSHVYLSNILEVHH